MQDDMHETVFRSDGPGVWLASPLARGPFGIPQGGAIAGLMCAEMEWTAERDALGLPVSITTHLLRPAPNASLSTSVAIVHSGRRFTILEGRMTAGAVDIATARACFIKPAATPAVPDIPRHATTIDGLPERKTAAPLEGPWFLDTMEVRQGDGIVWFRIRIPIVSPLPPLARMLGPADWAHGLARPDGWEKPTVAIPNPEITVHLSRVPTGEWIGLDARSMWRKDGVGCGHAVLWDEHGEIGTVAMAVVLIPLG